VIEARPTPPRIALTAEEAAACLGMSRDSFDRHVKNEVPMVRRGRLRLFPVDELSRWVAENAERTLEPRSRP
jgi:excisionase family DNA binding protein